MHTEEIIDKISIILGVGERQARYILNKILERYYFTLVEYDDRVVLEPTSELLHQISLKEEQLCQISLKGELGNDR